ncbi:hypothetical protein N656DRAFT_778510 [Canariomyces notabilis]|uniref:Uncharacterized protein n=1 Tax=Canariomyces notabilis TaxID=2074819 RepID=A0AAN6YSP3_9PEZI|nr:hypothetical protein N656DRAFT_778510 [Canariomyces arenarius]
MKATFLAAMVAMATSVAAAPLVDTSAAVSVSAPPVDAAAGVSSRATGNVVQDLAPGINQVLTVTGPNAEKLLIELSPSVAGLLSGLGLPSVGVPVGSVIASAATVGELVKDLGNNVEGLLTVVGADVGALLIQLSPEVAGLVSGLGLPSVGVPVGTVVGTLGANLKRREVVQDLAPQVQDILEVTGPDAKRLLIQLSPSVAGLLAGLGLPGVGVSVGQVVATAGSVGDLLQSLGAPVAGTLTVVGQDGGLLLVQLAPSVASLVAGLGLPGVGVSVGTVVATLGANL